MSPGCRYCHPDNLGIECVAATLEKAPPVKLRPTQLVYVEFARALKHGTLSELLDKLLEIEFYSCTIPGVSAWCFECRRKSIISYTLYLHLNQQDNMGSALPEHKTMSVTEYYMSLCDLADNFFAQRLLMFT